MDIVETGASHTCQWWGASNGHRVSAIAACLTMSAISLAASIPCPLEGTHAALVMHGPQVLTDGHDLAAKK